VGDILKKRIRQARFDSPAHEALLNLLVAAAHVRQLVDEAVGVHGITQAQFNVLRILRGAHPNGYPRGEIACRMIDHAPDVTRLIDRLERQGLVERTRSGDDRRQSITVITEKGLNVLSRIDPAVAKAQRVIARRLSADDLRQLSRLCEHIYGDA
jgi:DNA-binding MarR family transcriptional regulator